MNSTITANLENAILKNDYVISGEVPETNTAFINEIEIQYFESGGDLNIITDNYSGIFSIASQCPQAEGPAVERARTFVAMINDTLSYNDDNVCLQSGIYRHANTYTTTDVKNASNEIIVKPNPANDKVEIILKGKFEGLCKIQIRNVLGEIILSNEMNCKEASRLIDVSDLAQGVYTVQVNINNSNERNVKLIIVR